MTDTPQHDQTKEHERGVQIEIFRRHQAELKAMSGLYRAVEGMMTAESGWRIGRRGIDRVVMHTMLGLLSKALKTFRSVHILCERGFRDDAIVLNRVLMETALTVAFILQKRSKERARLYHASSVNQELTMLKEWTKTHGLKKSASKSAFRATQQSLDFWKSQLPPTADISRWKVESIAKQLGLRWTKLYQTFYRFSSPSSHASDFSRHTDASGEEFVWQLWAQPDGVAGPMVTAREFLWHVATAIDERIGLGFGSSLAPHKLTAADLPKR